MKETVANSHIAEIIKSSGSTSYDENAKELLCDKVLLAHIISGVVDELEGWGIDEIIPCIEGEPEVSKTPVNIMPCVSGSNTEDIYINEGRIAYDIRFNIVLPAVDVKEDIIGIKLLVDVEMQARGTGLGYNLLNRAIYYASRMISSQNTREFINSNYDSIKKVYSIWICASPEAKYRNTILKYSLKEDVLYGDAQPRDIRSLINVVLINLDGHKNSFYNEIEPTLLGLLNTIFTSPLDSDEKLKKLENIYHIPRTEKIKEGVVKMCNISEFWIEHGLIEGMEKGLAEGRIKGRIESLYYDSNKTPEEIALMVECSIDFVNEVIGL